MAVLARRLISLARLNNATTASQISQLKRTLSLVPSSTFFTLSRTPPPQQSNHKKVQYAPSQALFSTSSQSTPSTPPSNNDNIIIRSLPKAALPYAYLARMDKPIGTMLLLYPCWWSCALATSGSLPPISTMALFGAGAFIMRGAGCTINDMWDKNYDKNVTRTKTRPLANGDLTMTQATGFLGLQLTAGLGVLLSLPHTEYCFKLGVLSLPLVVLYPTAKRWTNYPQVLLGMTFNWGALMGWAAVHGDLSLATVMPLYVCGIAWTVIYDTLYAHQDKNDDLILGLKSTALTFGEQGTKPILYACSAIFLGGLGSSGYSLDMVYPFYLGSLAATGQLVWTVYTADLGDVENLAKRFKMNNRVGAMVTASILGGSLMM